MKKKTFTLSFLMGFVFQALAMEPPLKKQKISDNDQLDVISKPTFIPPQPLNVSKVDKKILKHIVESLISNNRSRYEHLVYNLPANQRASVYRQSKLDVSELDVWATDLLRIFELFPALESLKIGIIDEDIMNAVGSHPRLTEFINYVDSIESECLALLCGLKNLKKLVFKIHWPHLKQSVNLISKNFTQLEVLSIDYCSNKIIESLRHMKHLKKISCLKSELYQGINYFDPFQAIDVDDDGFKIISESFDELEVLNVPSENITDVGLQHLLRLTRLQELTIGASLPGKQLGPNGEKNPKAVSEVSCESMKFIAKFNRLRTLRLYKIDLSAYGLMELSNAPNLESLTLVDLSLDHDYELSFRLFNGKSLKNLSLQEIDLPNKKQSLLFEGIQRIWQLRTLNLLDLELTSYSWSVIMNFTHLDKLSMTSSMIPNIQNLSGYLLYDQLKQRLGKTVQLLDS